MDNFITVAMLTNIGYLVLALLAMFTLLRYFDRRMGFNFKDWISHLDGDSATPAERASLAFYLGMRILAVCVLMGMLLGCNEAHARSLSYTQYDSDIAQATKRYLPGVDWRLWKAQLYQESRLNPDATSPVGAAGVAQFMPATWRGVAKEMGLPQGASPRDAALAIQAGAYYMAQMRNVWRAADTETNRHSLACASYNAGAGNIRKAQRRAQRYDWRYVLDVHLPAVTGRHAKETQTYVRRIWRHYELLSVYTAARA